MIKKNKKASILLPEEGVKLVIAVLVIVILIVLAYNLYSILLKKTEIEQARATLNAIIGKIEVLGEGEKMEYLVTAPRKWYITAFSKGEDMPVSCKGENCLCICKSYEECDKTGVCKNPKKQVKIVQVSLYIMQQQNILLLTPPLPLFLEDKKDFVNVYIATNPLSEKDKSLFDNFLSSKYQFADKGEIAIEEQIKFFVNSSEWGRDLTLKVVFKGNKNMGGALEENIKNYFKDYEYPIWIKIKEKRITEMLQDTPSFLVVDAGGEKELKEGEKLPSWPVYDIDNPTGKIKKIIVEVDWRR